ncbi:CbiX/SirB N-terminal domain-containing protein [Cribrihabitans neustonicus]|uniref:CbiX/SirB N-terminal domain-containing protein n=1 Tax=Cribrihabitans neustonicus TaxID=1429085 RepID=UPI003B5C195A
MSPPPKTAILTAHGQPSAPAPPEEALARTAAEVASLLPGWEIRSATLATPGRLEDVMQEGAVIYPFFMARGWFTAKVLPGRLAGRSYRMAVPFGLSEGLPLLVEQAVKAAAEDRGWALVGTWLLLAAHGSARGPKAAEAAESFASRLRPLLPGCALSLGYVEQDPTIKDAARPLPARTLCLPFFAQAGDHVQTDIPEALKAAGFQGAVMPVTGALPGVPALIAAAIRAAAGAPPAE